MANNFEFIFMSLLAISLSSLEKKILLFHLGYFSLYCLIERRFFFFLITWVLNLYCVYGLQIFFPSLSCLSTSSFFFFCSEFCHTLKRNSHGFKCVPHPDPPSHLPLHPLPLGLPSAPGPSACLMHPTWAGDLFHPR